MTDAEAMDAFSVALPDRGHHPGASSPRTRWLARSTSAANSAPSGLILVNLSGRGDKDVDTASAWFGV